MQLNIVESVENKFYPAIAPFFKTSLEDFSVELKQQRTNVKYYTYTLPPISTVMPNTNYTVSLQLENKSL